MVTMKERACLQFDNDGILVGNSSSARPICTIIYLIAVCIW